MAKYYKFPEGAVAHLSARDKKLGRFIAETGEIKAETERNPFRSLANSIVSQQISGAAAASIWRRLDEKLGGITPENILNAAVPDIRACGMSERKAEYLRGAASAVAEGRVNFAKLKKASDEEFVKELTALKGVGVWTAEMLLIFTFMRHDVLSFNDLGIRRGIMKLHSLDVLGWADFEKYRAKYSPYGTVASLYLWRIAY